MSVRLDRPALGAALLWTLAVAFVLLVRIPPLLEDLAGATPASIPLDKLVHLALFLLLSRAWLRAVATGSGRAALWVLAAAIAYGGLLELAQLGVAERSADWLDFAADGLGAGLAPWSLRRLPARWL